MHGQEETHVREAEAAVGQPVNIGGQGLVVAARSQLGPEVVHDDVLAFQKSDESHRYAGSWPRAAAAAAAV